MSEMLEIRKRLRVLLCRWETTAKLCVVDALSASNIPRIFQIDTLAGIGRCIAELGVASYQCALQIDHEISHQMVLHRSLLDLQCVRDIKTSDNIRELPITSLLLLPLLLFPTDRELEQAMSYVQSSYEDSFSRIMSLPIDCSEPTPIPLLLDVTVCRLVAESEYLRRRII